MNQMTEISRAFHRLSVSFGVLAKQARIIGTPAMVKVKFTTKPQEPHRMPPSPALRLHGKYLGAIHGLKPADRVRAKKVRQAKGVHAAIAWARSVKK